MFLQLLKTFYDFFSSNLVKLDLYMDLDPDPHKMNAEPQPWFFSWIQIFLIGSGFFADPDPDSGEKFDSDPGKYPDLKNCSSQCCGSGSAWIRNFC